jgi:putative GTP pyrophosphokinase
VYKCSRIRTDKVGYSRCYMDVEEIKKEFKSRERNFSALEEEAKFILVDALKKKKIKTHSMPSRVKDLDSFLDKVKRKESAKPFEDIRDIVGLRVVCLFLSDLPKVSQVIRDSFNVLSEDDKIESAEVGSFGYMSVHFAAEMKKEYKGPRYDSVAGMPFEIQVRTILMDAWANVSHYLAYKTAIDVPSNLRRDFYALSGLFYVADSHFELFFRSSRESGEKLASLAKESHPRLAQEEINLDSVAAYLRSQFPKREHAEPEVLSGLIQQLVVAGYRTVGEIEALLKKTIRAVEEVEKDAPPDLVLPLSDSGVVRFSLIMLDEQFAAEAVKVVPSLLETFAKYRKLVKS